MKRRATNQEKSLYIHTEKIHISDKGLIPRIRKKQKNSYNSVKRRQAAQLKNWAKDPKTHHAQHTHTCKGAHR